MADSVVADIVHLVLMGDGEDNVGHGGRRRHEEVRHGHEIEVLEGFVRNPAVGPGDHWIRAHSIITPNGVRLAFQNSLAEKCRGDRHQSRDDAIVGAEHLLALVRNQVGADERSQSHDPGVPGMDVPAWDLEIAGDSHQTGQGAGGVEEVDVVLDGVSPLKGGGLRFGIHPGRLSDRIRGDPGDLRDLLGRVLPDMP